ncbi:beta-propeller fold lactonase family protein [Duganella sp. FT80W]|uniref:Beta-propeller fold lactonase family protein n=1 Tax=Duganella guangzhouensis TaxID=2666084 RepID=A0A6I2L2Q4_9BURK|nr:lactonase family protein [Duganella guangzhouensis]MRW92082.1 beta-propeller fold lactonase family protein [Duganella guangzhouensis]
MANKSLLVALGAAGWLAAGVAGAADCERIYIGTHQQGGAPSLFTATFNSRDGSFGAASAVASMDRPTWLVKDPARPLLYVVSEVGNDGATQGKVFSLRIVPGDGALAEVGSVSSGGGGPTHLALDARAGTLLVANYGTGQVAVLALDAAGKLSGPVSVVQDQGSGPTARQRGPHAHGVAIDPTDRYALVADLGADRVFIYRYEAATRQLAPSSELRLPAGTGPRHLVFGADGRFAYLLSEFTGELRVYGWDAGSSSLREVQTLSILSAGFSGKISAGEVIVSGDGGQVYVSNRSDNTVIAYQVQPGAGRLTELQRLPAGGEVPSHLALSPDGRWLLSSNEASSAVTVFQVAGDGRLSATARKLDVAKPVNVVFAGACSAAVAAARESAIQLERGDIKGTLTLPDGAAAGPVALLIADADATDRDSNAPGTTSHSLRQLARALAAQGIASVRYDKRGVGTSVGANGRPASASGSGTGTGVDVGADGAMGNGDGIVGGPGSGAGMAGGAGAGADLALQAADAAAWIELLKKDARFNKVVVIGHGEGALVGLLAANQVGAGGFVALAASGERTAAEFGKLKMHARIILGDADQQAGPDAARALEQARPGTPVAVIAGMNHALYLAQPGAADAQTVAPELVTALVSFLNKR